MKTGIETLVQSYIHDNSEYINDVASHLLESAENSKNGYFWYLTDEEVSLFESSVEEEKRLKEEVREFIINNY